MIFNSIFNYWNYHWQKYFTLNLLILINKIIKSWEEEGGTMHKKGKGEYCK